MKNKKQTPSEGSPNLYSNLADYVKSCERTEAVRSVDLSEKTLLALDAVRLKLIEDIPRFWQSRLTLESCIELLLDTIVSEYDEGRGSCQIVERLKNELRSLLGSAESKA